VTEKERAKKGEPAAPAAKSFEENLSELEGIVAELERGDLPLEVSIERYRVGLGALRACYEILRNAERQVEELTRDLRGALETRPFAGEEGGREDDDSP
jgi:exodeoxyribonuclease VII small subunit